MNQKKQKLVMMSILLMLLSGCCLQMKPPPSNECMPIKFHDQIADLLHRCRVERAALREAGVCEHQWEMLGAGRKGCPKCASIADKVNGKWVVVLANGIHVGPSPCRTYPNCSDTGWEGK